jgi:tetratricopeptide (TPR) repeat protein
MNVRTTRCVVPWLATAALLSACATTPEPAAPARPSAPSYDLVSSIRAAGAREKSIIDVAPLRDPGVTALQDDAQNDERAGRYRDAASKLDTALKLNPDSPDLLQDRAEIAMRLRDFATAEKLARQSWSIGPKLGPLCARNWQTIVEIRLQASDLPGANAARKDVQACHKEGISRY